jgi:hypothetical protein
MAISVQFRRGTAAYWTLTNPILAEGELGLETDTKKFKLGDGSTDWVMLDYMPTKGDQGIPGPVGKNFRFAKIYVSVAALLADIAPTNILVDEFAIISSSSADPDNGRVYVWDGTSYSFVVDIAGMDSTVPGPPGTSDHLVLSNVGTLTHDALEIAVGEKQATLVSGTSLKTINGESLLGAGNIALAGGSSSVARYDVGGGSYVVATGAGVALTKAGNLATLTAPAGVTVLSMSVHFTGTEVGTNTFIQIDFGIDQGAGLNSDYTNCVYPQWQAMADVAGNRSMKTGAAATFNVNSHTLNVVNLTASQAVWVNLSF